MPARLSTNHTVLGAMAYPSRVSSPWMRRYPQVGFSAASRRINRRSSGGVAGRRGGRWGLVQCRLSSCRCQRSNVSGVTNRWRRRCLGSSRVSAESTARSGQAGRGRVTCRRSTATSCRSMRISACLDACPRASSASQLVSWQKIRSSSRNVMTGDHRGPRHRCEAAGQRLRIRSSAPTGHGLPKSSASRRSGSGPSARWGSTTAGRLTTDVSDPHRPHRFYGQPAS
jgi:hypothetical protein